MSSSKKAIKPLLTWCHCLLTCNDNMYLKEIEEWQPVEIWPLVNEGVVGGMTVVEGLFSSPPVHYVLDWSRLVSTLVQEDKEEWWPVMCRKLVSDSFQTISKYFVQVLCCQFVQLGDSEDWWRGMYLLCKVFIYAAFHQFPSAHDRCQFLVGGQRGHCWFLIQTY